MKIEAVNDKYFSATALRTILNGLFSETSNKKHKARKHILAFQYEKLGLGQVSIFLSDIGLWK